MDKEIIMKVWGITVIAFVWVFWCGIIIFYRLWKKKGRGWWHLKRKIESKKKSKEN